MASRLTNITIDCDDVLKLAHFWSAVLGRPLDAGANAFFASIGASDEAQEGPAWYFNKVHEPKRAKNSVHLDLVNRDPSAVRELVGYGASIVAEHELRGAGGDWTVLQDPEGNELCIAVNSFTRRD